MRSRRRAFLRGLGGIAIGLPFLEIMLPKRASAAPAPLRYIVSFAGSSLGMGGEMQGADAQCGHRIHIGSGCYQLLYKFIVPVPERVEKCEIILVGLGAPLEEDLLRLGVVLGRVAIVERQSFQEGIVRGDILRPYLGNVSTFPRRQGDRKSVDDLGGYSIL